MARYMDASRCPELQSDPVWRRGLQIDRRSMLALLTAAPLYALRPTGEHVLKDTDRPRVLAALVDAFLPADANSPAGSELNVPQRITALARDVPNYPQMLQLGLSWLEETAQNLHNRPFYDLTGSQKDAVIVAAFAQPDQTLPRVFAARLRADCMVFYYGNPATWPSLGLDGPIQPHGYPDHDKAPSA